VTSIIGTSRVREGVNSRSFSVFTISAGVIGTTARGGTGGGASDAGPTVDAGVAEKFVFVFEASQRGPAGR